MLVSTDDGATWNSVVTSGLPNGPVVSVIYRSGTLYASVWGSGVYSSADGGSTWTQVGSSASFTNKHVYQLRFDANGSLYVVVAANNTGAFVQGGFYKLVSGSWQKLSSGLETLLAQHGASLAPYDFLMIRPILTSSIFAPEMFHTATEDSAFTSTAFLQTHGLIWDCRMRLAWPTRRWHLLRF